jgi:hypothetical protein
VLLTQQELVTSCAHLEVALKSGDHFDIDGEELHVELKCGVKVPPRIRS